MVSQSILHAVSRLWRSRTFAEFRDTYLTVVPAVFNNAPCGIYLFDDRLRPREVFAYRAREGFLDAYERLRDQDPLLRRMLAQPRFMHTREVVSLEDYRTHPLHDEMLRWGFEYSIVAPLMDGDRICGTLNFASHRGKYFDPEYLSAARIICEEASAAFGRVCEMERLQNRIAWLNRGQTSLPSLPAQARRVMDLLLAGCTNRDVARILDVSENTVRDHVKRLYRTLGVNTRSELARRAFVNPPRE